MLNATLELGVYDTEFDFPGREKKRVGWFWRKLAGPSSRSNAHQKKFKNGMRICPPSRKETIKEIKPVFLFIMKLPLGEFELAKSLDQPNRKIHD